jgi:osmotically inducible protein OsmC
MQLSHFLAENGTPADELKARAVVSVEQADGGFEVRSSRITLEARVPGIEAATFQELADKAKAGCPISKALGAIEVSLDAKLV